MFPPDFDKEPDMYARMDQVNGSSGHSDHPLDTGLNAQPGLLGWIALQQLAGPAAALVTLWDDQAGLEKFAGPGGVPGPVYQVAEYLRGTAAPGDSGYARLLYFDGPRAPEVIAAEHRAGRERIWPAVSGLDGLATVYLMRQPDGGSLVLQLATSVEALEAAERAVMSTELLPGEDPALLPGPDRVELHHVTGYHMAATS
jgi:hypothetical protein